MPGAECEWQLMGEAAGEVVLPVIRLDEVSSPGPVKYAIDIQPAPHSAPPNPKPTLTKARHHIIVLNEEEHLTNAE